MKQIKHLKSLFIAVLAVVELSAGFPIFMIGGISMAETNDLMKQLSVAITNNYKSNMPEISGAFGQNGGEEAKPEPIRQTYTVQDGDHIAGIARKFDILEKQLMEENKLESGKKIALGQVLVIPNGEWQSYEGIASWYGPGFHGRVMANGELYSQNRISVAHRTLPLGTQVEVTNLRNGKSITAPVLDRGPYIIEDGIYTRDIDLSYAAAKELGILGAGLAEVKIERLDINGNTIADAGKEVKG